MTEKCAVNRLASIARSAFVATINHQQPEMNATTQRWMGWTIGRSTSKEYGIHEGLPYLTGFVIHCEIVEESLAA